MDLQEVTGPIDPRHIGHTTCNMVLEFLRSSAELTCSVFTFTELFAFVLFEIDYRLYGYKKASRAAIADLLIDAFYETITSVFQSNDEEMHHEYIDRRMNEYSTMLRAHKEKSDIVRKLEFYLIQSSRLGKYISDDSCPIVLVGAFEELDSMAKLTQFYITRLAPYIELILHSYK